MKRIRKERFVALKREGILFFLPSLCMKGNRKKKRFVGLKREGILFFFYRVYT